MSQPGRVLSLLVVIDEPENAGWIWESMKNETHHGVRVWAAANGSIFDENEIMEAGLKHIAGHITLENDEELEALYDDSEKADEILQRAQRCGKKYEYDPVLCRYNHDLIKPLPGKDVRETGNEGDGSRIQDTP